MAELEIAGPGSLSGSALQPQDFTEPQTLGRYPP